MLSIGEICRKMRGRGTGHRREVTRMSEQQQYLEALAIVAQEGQASVSKLQRAMSIGYSKAAKFIQQMEDEGHIGPYNGNTPRTVNIKPEDVHKPKANKRKQTTKKAPASRKKPAGNTKTAQKATAPKKATQKPEKGGENTKSRKGIGGRPKLWEELEITSKLDAIKGWCMQGATMQELADMIGCGTTTLYEWRRDYPEFAAALRAGRNVANGELLAAAFNASSGFYKPSKVAVKYKTVKVFKNPKTGEEELRNVEEVKIVDVMEYVPPNAQLLQFMLYNRLPEHYRKTEHVNVTGNGNGLSNLSDEELEAELRAMEGAEDNDTGTGEDV